MRIFSLHPKIYGIPHGSYAGYIKSYIILPATIYGRATGPFVTAGLQNPASIQIPVYINAGLDRGQGGVIGLGKNLWPSVEIHDRACLTLLEINFSLLTYALSGGPLHNPVRRDSDAPR